MKNPDEMPMSELDTRKVSVTKALLLCIVLFAILLAAFSAGYLIERERMEYCISKWVTTTAILPANQKPENVQALLLNRVNEICASSDRWLSFSQMVIAFVAFLLVAATALGIREYMTSQSIRESLRNDFEKLKTELQSEFDSLKKEMKKEHMVMQAKSYIFQHAYTESWNILEELQGLYPREPEVMFLKGIICRIRAKYDAALQYFASAQKFGYKEKEKVFYQRGRCFTFKHEYGPALEQYDKALAEQSKYPECLIMKAYCIKRTKKEVGQDIIQLDTEAIALEPSMAIGYYNLACYYALLQKEEEAKWNLTKAIELHPKYKMQALWDADFKAVKDKRWFQEMVCPKNCVSEILGG